MDIVAQDSSSPSLCEGSAQQVWAIQTHSFQRNVLSLRFLGENSQVFSTPHPIFLEQVQLWESLLACVSDFLKTGLELMRRLGGGGGGKGWSLQPCTSIHKRGNKSAQGSEARESDRQRGLKGLCKGCKISIREKQSIQEEGWTHTDPGCSKSTHLCSYRGTPDVPRWSTVHYTTETQHSGWRFKMLARRLIHR